MHSDETTETADNVAWKVILATTVFRVLWLLAAPFELSPDECYYWDWGRRLDWGYFSKPPLIGWVYSLTGWWHADSATAVRVLSVGIGLISVVAFWRLARYLEGPAAGLTALLIAATMPAGVALNYFLTPDILLIAAWCTALFALARAWRLSGDKHGTGEERTAGWWCLYFFAGTMGVLAKQMMLVLPIIACVFLVTDPNPSKKRRRWTNWVALFVPLAGLLPTLWWNMQHVWVTLDHTAHHFSSEEWTPAMAVIWAGRHIAGQIAVAGPVMFAALLLAAAGLRHARSTSGRWFVWLMSVPPLAGITALALRQEINPNWPAAFYIGGMLLLAGWLHARPGHSPRLTRTIWISGSALSIIGCLAAVLIAPLGLGGSKVDFTKRANGWIQFARQVDALRAKTGGNENTRARLPVMGVDVSRKYISSLAFYLPDQPRVWGWRSKEGIVSQYDIWPDAFAELNPGDDLLVMSLPGRKPPPEVVARFEDIQPAGAVSVSLGKKAELAVDIWLGRRILPATPATQTTNRKTADHQ